MRGRIDELLKPATSVELLRAQDRFVRTREYLATFPLILFDAAAGAHFDRLRSGKRTWKGGHADLLIACIALAHAITLVTRNTQDFAGIPGLKVENWAD
jgi:tRNA(fMet)-specific endonuclease VapC